MFLLIDTGACQHTIRNKCVESCTEGSEYITAHIYIRSQTPAHTEEKQCSGLSGRNFP